MAVKFRLSDEEKEKANKLLNVMDSMSGSEEDISNRRKEEQERANKLFNEAKRQETQKKLTESLMLPTARNRNISQKENKLPTTNDLNKTAEKNTKKAQQIEKTQNSLKKYNEVQNELTKNTISYQINKNADLSEKDILEKSKVDSRLMDSNFIKTLASQNPTERKENIKNLPTSAQKYYQKQALAYNTEKDAIEEANRINEEAQKGNYLPTIGHVLNGLTNKTQQAIEDPVYAVGSLINVQTPIARKINNIDGDYALQLHNITSNRYDTTTANLKSGVARTASNISGTIGYMVPSILTSMMAPETNAGRLAQAISVAGSGYNENINEDSSNKLQSLLTGIGKGTASYTIEGITGGNILGKGSLDDLAVKTIASKTSSKVGQKIASMIYEVGGETLEEELENQVDYLIDAVVNNKGITLKQWLDEQGQTIKDTTLSTLVLKMLGLGGNTYNDVKQYSQNAEMNTWINEAEKIINKENLTIDTEKLKVKNNLKEVNNILNNLEEQNLQQGQANNTVNLQTQQTIQEQNKMSQNQALEQIQNNIANNQERLYNNNESESDINEGIYSRTIERDGRIENAVTNQRGQTEDTGISQKNISEGFKENRQRSYEEFIDYANKNKIELDTVETKSLRKIANDLGMNAILFNGDGNSDYIGMTDKQNPNNVYIDMNQKEIRGEDMLYHEFLHSRKRNSDSIYRDKVSPIEQDIVQNYSDIINNFIEEKGLNERYKNYPELIAEEIIADYTSKHLGNLEIDYDLPQFYIEAINQAVDEMKNNVKSNNIQQAPTAKNNVLATGEYTKQNRINQNNIEINSDLPISENQKFRKHYKSIIQSQYTSDEARAISKELMKSDTYVPESNNKQLERADKRIELAGADSELNSLMSRAMTGGNIKADDIAVGERLIQYYSKTGNKAKLQEAIQATAMAGTTAGQTVQAMSLLNHQTPEGQAVWLQRSVDKMNNDLVKARGKKAEQFNLTPEMTEKIINSKGIEELQNNLNKVYEELGQQVTKTTLQKIDAWRYFSMLANPKTHIRNIVGNTAMSGMQYGIKNKIAGSIEAVASKINPKMERTHTIVPASKEVKQFAKNDIKNVADRLGLNENKYNPKTRLENSMRTFKSDVMENTLGKLFDLNDKALEAEDGWGLKAGYTKALSEYMTANKLTPDNITDKQLAKARNYAIEQAQEATFHQASAIATALNQFQNKNKFTKFITDATLPFKKTPINVAKAGLEYSPIGLVKSAIYDTVQLRKGNITVNKYIDNISKGLTGTGIALVGYALANAGILKASGSDDKDKESYDEDRGYQTYSIQIGDNTYSLDWLAPTGIPLFIGAECYEIMKTEKETKTSSSDEDSSYNQTIKSATNILDAFTNAMNPMTEMSMLSGLTSALKSYDGDNSKMLANLGINATKSYVNQFIPTALGQIAKTTDGYERSTTSTKTGTLPKAIDSTKNYAMSKIPGLRQMLPTKTDVWGNELKQSENIAQRALENAVLPWTRKEVSSNTVDKELSNVYNNTGESSVLPDSINKNLTINKQKYVMTSEEYAKYRKQYGQNSYKLLNNLVTSTQYKKLSNSQKQVAIEKVYEYAKEQIKIDYAKNNNLDYEESKLSKTLNTLKKSNANTSNYLEYLALTKDMDKTSEKMTVLSNVNFTDKTKQLIYENNLLEKTDKKYEIIKNTGLNINSYLKYKLADSNEEFSSDKKDNGTVKGKTITNSAKNKRYKYIMSITGTTYTQRLILFALEYEPSSNTDKQQVINYVSTLKGKTNKEKLDILGNFKGVTIYKNGTFDY